MSSPAAPAPSAGRILLLGALVAFGAMSIDMYLPSLPTMAAALGVASGAMGQTIASFIAGQALGQLVWGPMSDRIGRRAPLFAGLMLYMLASAACALAQDLPALVAARFVQGLGSCAAMVIARAIVRDEHGHHETARIFSWLTLVMGLAPMFAPALGALVLELAGWRAIFWALAGFGLAVTLAAACRLPETRGPAQRLAARAARPLATYAALLADRRLLGHLLGGGFASAGLFAYIASSAELYIEGFGLSPGQYAWAFGANGAAFVGAAQLNRALLRRHPPGRLAAAGLLAAAGVALLFALAALAGLAGLWLTMAALFVLLAGFGLVSANINAGALSLDPLHAGSIAALMGAGSFGIGAVVAALTSALADGSALPLALTMAACQALAALGYLGLARGQ